jgi:hypothetical protein
MPRKAAGNVTAEKLSWSAPVSVEKTFQDERYAKRPTADGRTDRVATDRPNTQNRESADVIRMQERRNLLRDVNTKLPQPPEMPGFHMCWLTTTNQSDPLEHRFRRGYSLVKQSELPGFKMDTQQSGQVDEYIRVNEMVLAKIERDLWLDDMKTLHHDMPLEQLDGLRNSVSIRDDGRGNKVGYTGGEFSRGLADGYAGLGRSRPASFVGVG